MDVLLLILPLVWTSGRSQVDLTELRPAQTVYQPLTLELAQVDLSELRQVQMIHQPPLVVPLTRVAEVEPEPLFDEASPCCSPVVYPSPPSAHVRSPILHQQSRPVQCSVS